MATSVFYKLGSPFLFIFSSFASQSDIEPQESFIKFILHLENIDYGPKGQQFDIYQQTAIEAFNLENKTFPTETYFTLKESPTHHFDNHQEVAGGYYSYKDLKIQGELEISEPTKHTIKTEISSYPLHIQDSIKLIFILTPLQWQNIKSYSLQLKTQHYKYPREFAVREETILGLEKFIVNRSEFNLFFSKTDPSEFHLFNQLRVEKGPTEGRNIFSHIKECPLAYKEYVSALSL